MDTNWKFKHLPSNVIVNTQIKRFITNKALYCQQEDKTPGYTVLRFDVEDADTEANGPPYKFDIVEGQPDHEFKVDGDGVLTTAARFNRDIKDQYDLVIRVYDNGNPSLFTDTTVRVLLYWGESDIPF